MTAAVRDAPAGIDPVLLRQRVSQLPALPKAAIDALAALRDDDASIDHCARCIGRDQALTARTLQLANSAFYGVPGRVASIVDAIQLLGRRTLRSVLTTATVSTRFNTSAVPDFDFDGFWRHCIGTALAAEGIARVLILDQELAFNAGLLHDVGRLALVAHFPQQTAVALRQARQHDVPIEDAERATLAIDHAAVGAIVAGHWNFPAAVVEAIAGHHAPALPASGLSLACVVHAADAIAHALDLAHDEHEMVPELCLPVWERLALTPLQCLDIFERTEQGVAALSQVLSAS